MKNIGAFFLVWTMALVMMSCNLSDFGTNNLLPATGLNPVLYRPFTNGTYAVKDYTVFPEMGMTPVKSDSLNFKGINYPLNGMTFNTSASDSMVVIIKTVNETPMKYRYWLTYEGKVIDSGSKLLGAAIVNAKGDILEASQDSIEYKLNTKEVTDLGAATQIDLAITLYKPGTPVIANVLKASQISFRIGFRAPVNLLKIK